MAGGTGGFGFLAAMSIGVYNWTSLTFILLLWLAEFLFLFAILERGLYKNVHTAQPTTEKVFYFAASHNLMVGEDNFDPAKLSTKIFRFVRFLIIATNIYLLYFFYSCTQKFGQEIELGNEFWLGGLLFYVLVLMYNQNNPVRFAKIMKLYSQGKVLFKKEQDDSGA